ncbi:toll-like receptor 4 [Mya arenaria]|uniref:toll-like receptor 4 n=1 Tax=Mya arenaria TaxID=6604 RepID=UPI0022E67824|nr:toll-like receptor 4 [Mya arenaria]
MCMFLLILMLYVYLIGVLKDFRNILTLDLSDNVLDIYNKTAFDPSVLPSSLRILKLFGNFREDSKLEKGYAYPNFSNLRNLAMLQMDGVVTDFDIDYENSGVRNLTLSSKGPLGFCSIKEIFPTTFHSLVNVRVLDVSSCRIENIYRDAFKHMKSLEILDLSLNRRLGFSSLMNVSYSLQFTNIQFLNYSRVYTSFGLGTILLSRDICYLRNTSLKAIAFDDNRIEQNTNLLLPEHLETIYAQENKFSFGRWKIRYWFDMTKQNYFGYRRLVNDYETENYRYDAFISYSDHDLHFIRDEIIPRLEDRGMKLCVHERDFLPGISIWDNIVDAIRTSKKTVVILFKTFVKKQWCIFEFNKNGKY